MIGLQAGLRSLGDIFFWNRNIFKENLILRVPDTQGNVAMCEII
jgi:hypothetical protein